MLLPEKTIFANRSLKICLALIPRLCVLLVLLSQRAFWENAFSWKAYGLLFVLLVADLLISAVYVTITARLRPAAAVQPVTHTEPGNEPLTRVRTRSTFTDAVFFMSSLLAFYFIDYVSSDLHLFGRNSNPYDNILLMLLIQFVLLGFFFLGTALRSVPRFFEKHPCLPLALGAGICGLSFVVRDPVLAPLLSFLNTISQHIEVICAILYCLSLFYLLCTGLYGCYKKYIQAHTPAAIIVTVISVITLPLVILLTGGPEGNGSLFCTIDYMIPGLFRTALQNNLFWGGVFLLLSGLTTAVHIKNASLQKALFIVLCLSLPLTLYLCLVLLPFFSIIFVFALFQPSFLLFFLPYLFLLFHVRALLESGRVFRRVFAARNHTGREFAVFTPLLKTILVSCALGFLLPLFVTVNALLDKAELRKAYSGMYDSTQVIGIDDNRLKNILVEFGAHASDSYLPLVSPLRKAIILEHKELSRRQRDNMLAFYFGYARGESFGRGQTRWPRLVRLEAIQEIAYVKHDSYRQSKVLIRADNSTRSMDEFYVRFELPPDVFITGLSLWIDGSERRGILTAREPALTVYEQISRSLRDPALLMYEDDGSCSLRIFPVEPGKTRRAAITFLYREPFSLSLGGRVLILGYKGTGGGREAATTPMALRQEYEAVDSSAPPDARDAEAGEAGTQPEVLHFIIDYSSKAQASPEKIRELITACVNKINWRGPVRYTAANYNWKSYDSLPALLSDRSLRSRGSLVYSRVLRGLLREYKKSGRYPRFIFVSDTKAEWLILTSLLATKINFPGLHQVYRLDYDGNLFVFPAFNINDEAEYADIFNTGHAFPAFPKPLSALIPETKGLSYPPAEWYIEDNPGAGMNKWQLSTLIFALWCDLDDASPSHSARIRQLSNFAVRQDLLLPSLSYMVLENAGQEQLLKKAADNDANGALLQNVNLEPTGMDDGLSYVMLLILLLVLPFFARLFFKKIP